MAVVFVRSIENTFSNMENPEKKTKDKNHNIVDILVIALCRAICSANYLLAAKENQPTLCSTITKLFSESNEAIFDQHFQNYSSKQTNKDHSRLETRRCWVFTDLNKLSFDMNIWKGLSTFVVSERTLKEITTTEHRLYVTSEDNRFPSSFYKSDAKSLAC